MRRVVVDEWMSLDGVVQAPGAPEEDTTGGFQHGVGIYVTSTRCHRSGWSIT
jgi:hypothetical protein